MSDSLDGHDPQNSSGAIHRKVPPQDGGVTEMLIEGWRKKLASPKSAMRAVWLLSTKMLLFALSGYNQV